MTQIAHFVTSKYQHHNGRPLHIYSAWVKKRPKILYTMLLHFSQEGTVMNF